MPKFEVRMNCEYSMIVEADSEDEAVRIGNKTEPKDWDTEAWSRVTAEEIEE